MSDAAELEAEAEAARARLSDTAEQIRARMSPGQLMDEVLNQFRGGDGTAMLANLRGQVRDNPMALALVGSGLAWLMLGSGADGRAAPSRARAYAGPDTGNFARYRLGEGSRPGTVGGEAESGAMAGSVAGMAHGASDALASARSTVGEGLHAAGDRAQRLAEGATDALASARSTVGEGLHAAGDRAQRMTHDLASAGGDAFGELRHSAAGAGSLARDTFLDVLDREPLVIGAIGVAVGAAIGAFLPATDIERQHLGPAGEALKEKADALVDQGVAKAKEAAAEVYATARDEADRQGLLPGDTSVAEKVDKVVKAVGETAGGIVERSAAEAAPDSDRPPSGRS